jgi:hypothetical protein
VRCSTFPPIVARFRIWAEAACRQAEASAPAAGDERVLADLVQRRERADAQFVPVPVDAAQLVRPPMSTTRSGAAMPSRNQLSSSVPPAITDVRGSASAPAAASAVPALA